MHRIGKIAIVLVAASLIILALHRPGPESRPPRVPDTRLSASTSKPDPGPTIGYLDTREHRITLHGSGVYTIATKGGHVLAGRVTLAQLQASNPLLHDILQRAVAERKNNEVSTGPVLMSGPDRVRPPNVVPVGR